MSLEIRRMVLLVALGVVSFVLWQAWQREHPQSQPVTETVPSSLTADIATDTSMKNDADFVPSYANEKLEGHVDETTKSTTFQHTQLIKVKTDVLNIAIDSNNGKIVSSQLLKYPQSIKQADIPVELLTTHSEKYYTAASGISKSNIIYQAEQTAYELKPQQKNIEVRLTGTIKEGVQVTKVLTFYRGNYQVKVHYDIKNQSQSPWSGNFFYQLQRKDVPQQRHSILDFRPTYLSAVFSSADKPFDKYKFKKLQSMNYAKNIKGGWVAMLQHYFVGAWIPQQRQIYHYYSHVSQAGLFTVGFVGPKMKVNPGDSLHAVAPTKLYIGPELVSQLKLAAPHLELTVDYGWLWIVSAFLFKGLTYIYDLLGNWGWSIVILTLLIKLAFYHLSATSYRSMANMRRLQPQLTALKERYGDDRQKFSQAMMELYRKEGINPLSGLGGGCLPMLIQIPVFIALYWVLLESVELRQAPFMLWIQDLSTKDPYYVLPIIMGITMLIQQRLSPAPPDPAQAKVMMLMPVVFTFLFISFPAGLVVYWIVNNSLSILQQWYVMKQYDLKNRKQRYKKK